MRMPRWEFSFSDARWVQSFMFLLIYYAYVVYFATGVGGYSYLLEPLWWAGMITSRSFLSL
jgi:hypothetical protein